jgi:hypothetical protein
MGKKEFYKQLENRFNEILELRQKGVKIEEGVVLSDGTVIHNPVTKKVISPDKWVSKQVERAKAGAADWKSNYLDKVDLMLEAGKAAEEKWADKMSTAIKEKRRLKGLEKVSPADVRAIVETLGEKVFIEGIEARQPKIKKVVSELQPLVQAVSDTIRSMPDKTDADREKRLIAARKLMIDVGKKRKGIA